MESVFGGIVNKFKSTPPKVEKKRFVKKRKEENLEISIVYKFKNDSLASAFLLLQEEKFMIVDQSKKNLIEKHTSYSYSHISDLYIRARFFLSFYFILLFFYSYFLFFKILLYSFIFIIILFFYSYILFYSFIIIFSYFIFNIILNNLIYFICFKILFKICFNILFIVLDLTTLQFSLTIRFRG